MTPNRTRRLLVTSITVLVALWALDEAEAQTIRLRQQGATGTRVNMQVGQTINIEVFADLQGVASSGISFFISVPEGAFVVNDQGLPGQAGTQPFRFATGGLFDGAVVSSNLLLPESDALAATIPGQQLQFSAVIGVGSDRNRTGSGVVATFQMIAVQPIENGRVSIDDNPVQETKLVLSDGISERRFVTTQGMEITVSGLELLDIPDVILQPGQSDSVQIGSLDNYVRNTLSPADSIRWSFEPAEPESLIVTIDPRTRIVKVEPVDDWRGRVRLVWTATDPQLASPGQPPLQATEVSDIVVNNRPLFDFAPGPDGVKRYSVRLVEDRNTFIPGTTNLDPRRAFRDIDLDNFVIDPDVIDPDTELRYLFSLLPIGLSVNDANVRGSVADNNHELLIWSRPDFGGTDSIGTTLVQGDTTTLFGGRDSMRVLVRDAFGGQDTLKVIVEVIEVPDAPRILETEVEPRISRGSVKRYPFKTFAEDPDTPLEDLIITWVNDPQDHFIVDTTRVNSELQLEVQGDPGFTGTGRVVVRVADPLDPNNLFDEVILFFQSAEALPPDIFPPEIKIGTMPDGLHTENLDLFVSDPDNDDADLRWSVPPVSNNQITIDQQRTLAVYTPKDFVGYEEVTLTVLDPGNQSDMLKLRIYSSDGRPVTGGIPDVTLDRGQSHRELDLDNYYHDANNPDEQMAWSALPTFDTDNLTVSIDGLTHLVTFFADERSTFGTETVIFRVTDPSGVSDEDTMLVTIVSGGTDSGGDFTISPPIPQLEAPVGPPTTLLDLHDHIQTSPSVSRSSITWSMADPGRVGIAGIQRRPDAADPDGVRWLLTVFSDSSGVDTVQFVATDSLGRSETATTTIRYFGESERLQLLSLPDIVFISGTAYTGLTLNDFIADRQAHPDSAMMWSHVDIGQGEGNIIIQINKDSSVRALSFDITQTQVVFTARDTILGVTGRDTVRVFSQDPALGQQDLQPMPDIVLQAGTVDSSIVLNDFLPEDIEPGNPRWSVSGQTLTVPIIDPASPHKLRISSVGVSVGTDTLQLRVDLGGGFVATGDLTVTIIEPVDESTLSIRVVPNPLSVNYVDFFVMARTNLTSSPTVVVSFEGDTTVAVRQIEDDLSQRHVLIWAGSFRVRLGGTGTLQFRAQAITALGSSVSATASIAVGTTRSGKALALRHGGVQLVVPNGAVDGDRLLYLQSMPPASGAEPAARAAGGGDLSLDREILLYPADLELRGGAWLQVEGTWERGGGLYAAFADGWRWLSGDMREVRIDRLGRYGVLYDHTAPILVVTPLADAIRLGVTDAGSGTDPGSVFAELDGQRYVPEDVGDGFVVRIAVTDPAAAGEREVTFVARDRAGNEARREVRLVVAAVPTVSSLGENFPNPFNPGTEIPFELAARGDAVVELRVYNAAGQMVRELLDRAMSPGRHVVSWDGRDESGRLVGSGVYYYRLRQADWVQSRPMTLLK